MNIMLSLVVAAVVILPANGAWQRFSWGYTDPVVATEFAVGGPALLQIADCGRPGDMFQVWDVTEPSVGPSVATLLGETSPPGVGARLTDADECFGSGYHSVGSWVLDAGPHTIRIEVIQHAPPNYDFAPEPGYIRAVPVAPTLPVWAALGAFVSLIGAGAFALRRIA